MSQTSELAKDILPRNPSKQLSELLAAEFQRTPKSLPDTSSSVRQANDMRVWPDCLPDLWPASVGRGGPVQGSATQTGAFLPAAPKTLEDTGLTADEIEALVLKYLLFANMASGVEIARQIALPFTIVEQLLGKLKEQRLLAQLSISSAHDSMYGLTEQGSARGRRYAEECSYFGAAPVSLADYHVAVASQSIRCLKIDADNVRKALSDLTLSEVMLNRVCRAVRSGKGLFLYGASGNGKSCIAERIADSYDSCIWIPRTLNAFGDIIRLYDPHQHVLQPLDENQGDLLHESIDHRWVRIKRPVIIVRSELAPDDFEIRTDGRSGIGEAPLQLKSNCGTLVIDDFGRQNLAPAELLNRWIVPLEKRYDLLSVANGVKVAVPFDQFVIFSTHLEPRALADEAFLRRIPYKIGLDDPTEELFRKLFAVEAAKASIECAAEQLDFLIEHCYRSPGRAMRFCHARDFLHHIEVYCDDVGESPRLSREAIAAAASNYFAGI